MKQPDLNVACKQFRSFVQSVLTLETEMLNCFELDEHSNQTSLLELEDNLRRLLETLKNLHITFHSFVLQLNCIYGQSKANDSNDILQLLKNLKAKLKKQSYKLSENRKHAIFLIEQLIYFYAEKDNVIALKNGNVQNPWLNLSILDLKAANDRSRNVNN